MKKIKLMFLVAFLSVASYAGYSAYDYVTMSDAERFLLQNIEALTGNEPGDSHVPGYEIGTKKISGPNGVTTVPCCIKTEPHMLCASYIYATCVGTK